MHVTCMSMSPVHVEEDVSCGLSVLPHMFLPDLTHIRVVVGLPGLVIQRTHITDIVPWGGGGGGGGDSDN